MAALIATLLVPVRLAGGPGLPIGVVLSVAALALAAATLAATRRSLGMRASPLVRSWAVAGAAGFLVAGAGLVADLLDWPLVLSEVVAVLAVAAWWGVIAWDALVRQPRVLSSPDRGGRLLGGVSAACALLAAAAVVVQALEPAPDGAVPARLAYLLWGPWGLALAGRLRAAERDRPVR